MKRNTVNHISAPQVRSARKNKTCELISKFTTKGDLLPKTYSNSFICVSAIVEFLINDFFQSMQERFRFVDEQIFLQQMGCTIDSIENILSTALNPYQIIDKHQIIVPEQQPQLIHTDYALTGNLNLEHKVSYKTKPSLDLLLPTKRERLSSSKKPTSRKQLIKLSKQFSKQRRKSIEMLQVINQNINLVQEQLRQKLTKQPNAILKQTFKPLKTKNDFNKTGIPLLSEQYSYDYDGSVFPIKKISSLNTHRLKILNTTCRLVPKSLVTENHKSIEKVHGYSCLQTEVEDHQKSSKRQKQAAPKLLTHRKQSTTDSMKDLLRVCCQDSQQPFKNRIEELVRGRSIRIRQLQI